MRVKRFIGENVAETMGKIKRELGSDAVILQTRQFREGGFLGFFGTVKVEIMAAIEEPSPARGIPKHSLEAYTAAAQGFAPVGPGSDGWGRQKATAPGGSGMDSWGGQIAAPGELGMDSRGGQGAVPGGSGLDGWAGQSVALAASGTDGWSGEERRAQSPQGHGLRPENSKAVAPAGLGAQEGANLQAELRQMRSLLADVNKQMGNLGRVSSLWPQPLQAWADGLRDRGISEPIVKRLLNHVQQTIPEGQWDVHSLVWADIQGSVREICSRTAAILPGSQKPRVVALVGPTGVGKTTTIGKLAAGFSIVDKRKVALITADTYRVAAVEQLKTFAEIIGVPIEVVMTPAGLRDALAQQADKELVFVDTAGRSPRHDLHMAELRAFLDRAQPDLTMLVLSATTQTADQLQIFQRFESLATHLIFTKLDETVSAGSILNILDQTTLPTAYLAIGQNVPDDVEAADPELLTRYILGEEGAYA